MVNFWAKLKLASASMASPAKVAALTLFVALQTPSPAFCEEKPSPKYKKNTVVDFEGALAGDRHIEERMAGEERQHMIEKTDPARECRLSRSVEREAHGNFRFRCQIGRAHV